jgi:hypothetical protein
MQAFHLDMKMGQFRPEYLSSLFLRLRQAGYDTVVFEIEDKVSLDCIGSAAWCEAYSKEEFADILSNCLSAGLQAIPLIQTYGHLEWLLTHSPFQPLREQASIAYTICPLKEDSRKFLLRYVDEVCELFGNPRYIHLGGDEAVYMGTCPDCEAKVKSSSKSALYSDHMRWLSSHVLSRGSRPMLWADMILAHPECIDQLGKDMVWVDWNYGMMPDGNDSINLWGRTGKFTPGETDDVFQRQYGAYAFHPDGKSFRPWFYADYLIDKGFDVLIAPATRSSGDHCFIPSLNHASNVVSAALKLSSETRLKGILVTSWAVRLNPLETQWPLINLPQVLRANPNSSWQEALNLSCNESFNPQIPDFATHWKALGQSFYLAESHLCIDWECGYVGQMPPVPQLLVRRFKGNADECRLEMEKIETLRSAYSQAASAIHPQLSRQKPENLSATFWSLGIDAIQLRAREYLLYLRAQSGDIDKRLATEILWETESMADRWRTAMLRIQQPASVERELAMLYGESKRILPHISWGRFE